MSDASSVRGDKEDESPAAMVTEEMKIVEGDEEVDDGKNPVA
jgi:hypothetical protein